MSGSNNQTKQPTFPAFRTLGALRSGGISASLSDYHGDLRQGWHRHEDFVLALLLRGHVREQVGSREVLAGPLDVGVKAAGVRHTDHFWPKGGRIIRVSLSHAFVSDLEGRSLPGGGWGWAADSQATRPFLRLGFGLLHEAPHSPATVVYDGVCEILGALLPVKSKYAARHAPLWLRRAKERLDSSFADGTRLSQLAGEAGVHPVYFARQFRRFFGCSVGRYVRRLQLRAVSSLLAAAAAGGGRGGGEPSNLAQIACQAGFSDQAHMTRVLAAEFGITPASYRALLA